MDTLRKIILDKGLRKKILFVFGMFAIFRAGAAVTIPGIDQAALRDFFSGGQGQLFGLLNIATGGTMERLSVMMLGVMPYITATIIMQLLTMIFPALKAMYQEEGESGRKKFNQYSRLLTVPLSLMQGFGLLTLLTRQGVIGELPFLIKFASIMLVVGGAMFLMWLGELITEYGIGNGVSLIIFAGIVSAIPNAISQAFLTFDTILIPTYVGFLVATVLIVAGVVVVSEGERPIPISYAKRVRGMRLYGGISTYLPLKVNQAGVIPIIFALSVLLFPQMILGFLSGSSTPWVQSLSNGINGFISNQWIYGITYFIAVFLFTYFYTAVTFDPDAIATNLQKSGGFVPGMRPGRPTSEFLSNVISHITLAGGLFLGLIAVLPFIMQAITGFPNLAIGGTGLLIVVSVVLETVKQIKAQLTIREYD